MPSLFERIRSFFRRSDVKSYTKLIQNKKEWQKLIQNDATVPRVISEVENLRDFLLSEETGEKLPDYFLDRVVEESEFECADDSDFDIRKLYDNYYISVDKLVGSDSEKFKKYLKQDEKKLTLGKRTSQQNFEILYTHEASPYVDLIGGNLEAALKKYKEELGFTPYWISKSPITVEIYKFFGKRKTFKGYTYPNYAIELNESFLDEEDILLATPAHELFHKVQYNFGYRTKWFIGEQHVHTNGDHQSHSHGNHGHNHNSKYQNTDEVFSWFSEGTASWAEYYATGSLSDPSKLVSMYESPGITLFKNNATSFPFWNFVFEHIDKKRNNKSPHAINLLFKQLEKSKGDVLATVLHCVHECDNTIKDMDDLFIAFCKYRRELESINVNKEEIVLAEFRSEALKEVDEEEEKGFVRPLASNYHYKEFKNGMNDSVEIKIEVINNESDCLICELSVNEELEQIRLNYDEKEKVYKANISVEDFKVDKVSNIVLTVMGRLSDKSAYDYKFSCK